MTQIDSTDTAMRDRAVKRLKKRRDFAAHLLIYTMVNTFIVIIWAVTTRGFFWPIFPRRGDRARDRAPAEIPLTGSRHRERPRAPRGPGDISQGERPLPRHCRLRPLIPTVPSTARQKGNVGGAHWWIAVIAFVALQVGYRVLPGRSSRRR